MLVALVLALCQGGPVALASTTGDSRLPQDPVIFDEDWIRREEGNTGGAARYLSSQALMALLGDLDHDGVFDAPADVDALAWAPRPGASGPAPQDLLFSITTSLGPYEDGDLLRLADGQGVIVEVSEAELVAALQPTAGGFDLDAAARTPPGQIWFSVESDLSGTVLGDVLDGDVLVYDRQTGQVRRERSEAEIQALVTAATGSTTAIGDLLSLSFYPPTGELAFTVQAPTSADATVFGAGGGGRVLSGWSEADWQFQVETELDALAFVPGGAPQPPVIGTDVPFYGQGALMRITAHHGNPGGTILGYLAETTAYLAQPGQGIGFFFLDRADPWLQQFVRHGSTHPHLLDSSGSATFDWTTPVLKAGTPYMDLYFQALDVSTGHWSPPIVVRVQ